MIDSAGAGGRDESSQTVRDVEEQAIERLAVIRSIREQWDSYGQLMRQHNRRLEEVTAGYDAKNYFVQRKIAARRELGLFVDQLVREQTEVLDEAERETKAKSEAEQDRLQREKASASWG